MHYMNLNFLLYKVIIRINFFENISYELINFQFEWSKFNGVEFMFDNLKLDDYIDNVRTL